MARLTGRGWSVLAGAVVCGASGWLLGFPVLVALGGAGVCAVVVTVAVGSRPPAVSISRSVYPDRVRRGCPAFAQLTVRNTSSRRQHGFLALDRCGAARRSVAVRSTAVGASVVQHYELPTDARGVHQVGPLTLARLDPLGLVRSVRDTGSTTSLWVHPYVHPLRALGGAFARPHHAGTGALRGSLDLREVREYVVGDEVRHLHWKASARTGVLMVRDFADPAQHYTTVLLDTRPSALFEDAVEVAASVLAAAAAADHQCRLLTSCGVSEVASGPGAVRQMLDALTPLRAGASSLLPPAFGQLSGGGLVVVTAAGLGADGGVLAAVRRRWSAVLVVTFGEVAVVPGVTVLAAGSAGEVARRWNAVMA